MTLSVKMINAKRINPHSDIVGMVGAFGEQEAGAVPAFKLVNEHVGLAEKEAVRKINPPLAGIVTPVNV